MIISTTTKAVSRRRLLPFCRCFHNNANLPEVATSWIDGEFVTPTTADENSYHNLSPSNGSSLCEVQPCSFDTIDKAIQSSSIAFRDWEKYGSKHRGKILREMAQVLQQNIDELLYLEAIDTGIPIAQIRDFHIPAAIETLEYYAALSTKGFPGKFIQTTGEEEPSSLTYTRREPLGVCVGIHGWNYPLVSMTWKLAPALACGNVFLCKPSECTPLTSIRAAELWKDILPPGVLQVLLGEAETAQHLVSHPGVQKISLTGSTKTGIEVAQEASKDLKRLTLELGGKSAMLVFEDYGDLDTAVRVAMEGNFVNNGQVCSNCTRVFVEQTILSDFLDVLVTKINESIIMGDNLAEETNMGPLIMPPRNPSGHYDRVMGFITRAIDDDSVELIHGCSVNDKNYVEPTVFLCHDDNAEIAREEVFGPVMTILPFDSEEEAIERANNGSDYGLAAGVLTKNLQRAHRVSQKLEAGNVWVNNWNYSPVEMPFGPYKKSGYGKELGEEAIDHYSQIKTVYVESGNIKDSPPVF